MRKNINTPDYWDEKYQRLCTPNKVLYTRHKALYERTADMIFPIKHDVIVDFGAGLGPMPFLLKLRNFKFELYK